MFSLPQTSKETTSFTHVAWYLSGSLTCGDGENVPGIPVACATRNFTYLARGLCILNVYRNCCWGLYSLYYDPFVGILLPNIWEHWPFQFPGGHFYCIKPTITVGSPSSVETKVIEGLTAVMEWSSTAMPLTNVASTNKFTYLLQWHHIRVMESQISGRSTTCSPDCSGQQSGISKITDCRCCKKYKNVFILKKSIYIIYTFQNCSDACILNNSWCKIRTSLSGIVDTMVADGLHTQGA